MREAAGLAAGAGGSAAAADAAAAELPLLAATARVLRLRLRLRTGWQRARQLQLRSHAVAVAAGSASEFAIAASASAARFLLQHAIAEHAHYDEARRRARAANDRSPNDWPRPLRRPLREGARTRCAAPEPSYAAAARTRPQRGGLDGSAIGGGGVDGAASGGGGADGAAIGGGGADGARTGCASTLRSASAVARIHAFPAAASSRPRALLVAWARVGRSTSRSVRAWDATLPARSAVGSAAGGTDAAGEAAAAGVEGEAAGAKVGRRSCGRWLGARAAQAMARPRAAQAMRSGGARWPQAAQGSALGRRRRGQRSRWRGRWFGPGQRC